MSERIGKQTTVEGKQEIIKHSGRVQLKKNLPKGKINGLRKGIAVGEKALPVGVDSKDVTGDEIM